MSDAHRKLRFPCTKRHSPHIKLSKKWWRIKWENKNRKKRDLNRLYAHSQARRWLKIDDYYLKNARDRRRIELTTYNEKKSDDHVKGWRTNGTKIGKKIKIKLNFKSIHSNVILSRFVCCECEWMNLSSDWFAICCQIFILRSQKMRKK